MNIIKKGQVRFVGNFPPPFGGVTIKNELLLKYLLKYYEVETIKSNKKLDQFIWFLKSAFCRKPMIIGVSSSTGKSLLLTKLLYFFNKKTMSKSLYFMMGGVEAFRISKSRKEIIMYSTYKRVFVETEIMQNELVKVGMKNVSLYPNCRERKKYTIKNHSSFKCVFFSIVSAMKGVDLILESAKVHQDIIFDFYGEIDPNYKIQFLDEIKNLKNVSYCGVFNSAHDNVYEKLAEYDILLLPTRWRTEGVPGVLVEAKIASLPAIVSDVSYNSIIIENEVDGLVISPDSLKALNDAIDRIKGNPRFHQALKNGALRNSRKYLIETYVDSIVKLLSEASK